MYSRRRTVPIALVACLLLLLMLLLISAGCSRDNPITPNLLDGTYGSSRIALAPSPSGAFFPLAVGNRWHATGETRVTLLPNGGVAPFEEYVIQNDVTRELVGTEELFGRTYVLQQEVLVETGPQIDPSPSITWTRFRQDAGGLYEVDGLSLPESTSPTYSREAAVATSVASSRTLPEGLRSRMSAERAAAYDRAWATLQSRIVAIREVASRGTDQERVADLLSNEITRLSYPLHPGASWSIRATPSFTAAVESMDHLQLPAGGFSAYRVRIESELFSPGDIVHFWFGRSGLLQIAYHVTGVVTDENGNEIGHMALDNFEAVDEVDVTRR